MLRIINRAFISKISIYMSQASFYVRFFLIKTNDKFSKEYRKKPRTGEKPRLMSVRERKPKMVENLAIMSVIAYLSPVI